MTHKLVTKVVWIWGKDWELDGWGTIYTFYFWAIWMYYLFFFKQIRHNLTQNKNWHIVSETFFYQYGKPKIIFDTLYN